MQNMFKGIEKHSGREIIGGYHIHQEITPSPILSKDEPSDYRDKRMHLIAQDGPSDWGLPRPVRLYEVEPDSVCIYAGVKDENGRKLFTKDRVSFMGQIGLVVFERGSYGLYFKEGFDYEPADNALLSQGGFQGIRNDNFIPFLEIAWNFNEEDEIIAVEYVDSDMNASAPIRKS